MPHRLDRGMGLVGQLKGRMGDPGSLLGIVPLLLESKFSIAGVGNLADTTDDTLFSTTIKAKTLLLVGIGDEDALSLKLMATTLVSSGVVVLNGKAWWLIAEIVRSGAATQLGIGEYTADTATAEVMTKTAPAENLAADIVLKVTGASPTTGAANDVLAHGYSILGLKN